MANANLTAAKRVKNNEFYTQWPDIEREMNAYLEYDPDVFRGKTVLLPCDDPEWSNFTKFFALHFQDYGLRKLISTSYAPNSNAGAAYYAPTLFESRAPQYDKAKSMERGRMFVLEPKDIGVNEKIDIDDLQWSYLKGDGDFRSEEVTALRDEADFVITNPPFSLFREFIVWLMEGDVRFSIIGNKNAITYKEVFPFIRDNRLWMGRMPMGSDILFAVPSKDAQALQAAGLPGSRYRIVDGEVLARASGCWFTDIEHGRRHEPLQMMTMAENIKFNKKLRGQPYARYDNFDAIEVPFTDAIPSDFDGVMGVPITFLDKYNPNQFEILGSEKDWETGRTKTYPRQTQVMGSGKRTVVTKLNDGAAIACSEIPENQTYYEVEGRVYKQVYKRLFIHRKEAL